MINKYSKLTIWIMNMLTVPGPPWWVLGNALCYQKAKMLTVLAVVSGYFYLSQSHTMPHGAMSGGHWCREFFQINVSRCSKYKRYHLLDMMVLKTMELLLVFSYCLLCIKACSWKPPLFVLRSTPVARGLNMVGGNRAKRSTAAASLALVATVCPSRLFRHPAKALNWVWL